MIFIKLIVGTDFIIVTIIVEFYQHRYDSSSQSMEIPLILA